MNWENLYNDNSKSIKASEIGELLKKAKGEDFISFAMGAPDSDFFPVEEIVDCAKDILQKEGSSLLQYGDSQGYLKLRQHLVQIMNTKYSIKTQAENILLTSGSIQGLELCGRLFLQTGDTVLVERPTFIDAMNSLCYNNAQVIGVNSDDEGMDLDDLKEKLAKNPSIKMIYVIPDFQNPTGTCWSFKKRKEFMSIVSAYDVIVLEDNPYGEINYSSDLNVGLASLDQKNQVIFMGSLSKTFSPGIRIGWLAAAEEVIQKLILVKERCDLHSSIPDHAIAATYMDKYSYEDHVTAMCKLYKNRLDLLCSELIEKMPQCKFEIPKGGFFVWLQLPIGINCEKFVEMGLSQKVSCVPGTAFYAERDNYSFIRLNFTGIKEDAIKEGVSRLAKTLELFVDFA